MTKIELETFIKAKVEICFDLARSIDLHTINGILYFIDTVFYLTDEFYN